LVSFYRLVFCLRIGIHETHCVKPHLKVKKGESLAKIEHVFVLMLENRSFDHLLGFSGLPGVPAPPAGFGFQSGAVDQLSSDPPHEFDDVAAQIHGGAMDGFANSGGSDTMKGFDASEDPILVGLAKNNLYFDNWFSSMPGPTWPNRLFAHAASSGGLDNSLGALDSDHAVTNPGYALLFENGHIFDRLTAKGVTWRVYHHHGLLDIDFPQVLCLKGMVDKRNDRTFFRPFSDFASDVSRADVAGYTFIEPKYGLPSYMRGNSQHPAGTISLGERLIKGVYEGIFSQKVADKSALLITWDEHGGFFDHVTPPAAVPPGDQPLNHGRAKNPRNCAFDRFGIRVPAVLISPWLPAGLGTHVFGNNATFDHASIVRALRSTFSLGAKLTNRDDASPDWNASLLAQPRTLESSLPSAGVPKFQSPAPSLAAVAAQSGPSGNVLGMAQIAADIDWHIAERLGVPPLIVSEFDGRLKHVQSTMTAQPAQLAAPAERTKAHLSVLEYIAAVQARDAKLQRVQRRGSSVVKKVAAKPRSISAKRTSSSKKRRPRSRRSR
jgi:phospholipase C